VLGLAAVNKRPPFALDRLQAVQDAVTTIGWTITDETVVGCASGGIYRCDRDGRLLAQWTAHQGGVTRIALHPADGDALASAGEDGRVVLWRGREGARQKILVEENEWVEHLEWTPDGEILAVAARKTISLWRGAESLGFWYDARRRVLAMAWAPDGKRLATAANKGLYLWRIAKNAVGNTEPVQLLSFPGAPVSVAWHPGGAALAVGTQDGFLQIWRPSDRDGKARQLTMRGYPAKVGCLAWHPRRATIATAGGPDVVLWDIPSRAGPAKSNPLRHHQSTVTALAWSPDGDLLASGDRDGRLCVWGSDGEPLYSRRLGPEISALAWRPRGKLLLIGDTDGGLHRLAPADADIDREADED
jgi:WD40 repeat protein